MVSHSLTSICLESANVVVLVSLEATPSFPLPNSGGRLWKTPWRIEFGSRLSQPSNCLHQQTILYQCSDQHSILRIFSTLWPYHPAAMDRIWTHCLIKCSSTFRFQCTGFRQQHKWAWQWRASWQREVALSHRPCADQSIIIIKKKLWGRSHKLSSSAHPTNTCSLKMWFY